MASSHDGRKLQAALQRRGKIPLFLHRARLTAQDCISPSEVILQVCQREEEGTYSNCDEHDSNTVSVFHSTTI